MRSIVSASAILVVCGLVAPAAGQGPIWGGHMGCTGWEAACGLCAPPCGASLSRMGPSCCESVSSCAAHAWDGYCQRGACHGQALGGCQPEMPCGPAAPGASSCCKLFELFQWTQTENESPGQGWLKPVSQPVREPEALPTAVPATY